MSNLIDSDIQPLVASLVLKYLDVQRQDEAHEVFKNTSRHLRNYSDGIRAGKFVDNAVELVKIVSEYFHFKSRIEEVMRTCPMSPTIEKLGDAQETKTRFDIIIDTLKNNLHKIEKIPIVNSKKRKQNDQHQQDDEFNVSQTNTSTPETYNNNPKRIKKSTPHHRAGTSKEIRRRQSLDKSKLQRSDSRKYSTDDTSTKEDDGEDIESKILLGNKSLGFANNLENLTDAILEVPDLTEKIAEIINNATINEEKFNVEGIISKTKSGPEFDEILNEIIEQNFGIMDTENQTTTSPEKEEESQPSTIGQSEPSTSSGIKQRLRPRKPVESAKKKKIQIISNEPYSGQLPEVVAQMSQNTNNVEVPQSVTFVPFYIQGNDLIPISMENIYSNTIVSNEIAVAIPSEATIATVQEIPQPSQIETAKISVEIQTKTIDIEPEVKPCTPKFVTNQSFLESKSKSTPRRKANHIRILDFNQTPSLRRLSTVAESSTPPSHGIPLKTPGSAPPTMGSSKLIRKEETKLPPITEAVIDDSSNSNSVCVTPKVQKKAQRRKITDPKKDEKMNTSGDFSSNLDWNDIKAQRNLPIDVLMRQQNQQREAMGGEETKGGKRKSRRLKGQTLDESLTKKTVTKKRKTPVKKKKQNEKKKIIEDTEIDENKPLSTIKFKIASPRKVAALKKTPKKKKESIVNKAKAKFEAQEVKEKAKEDEIPQSSELNRSDTVQEVAHFLTGISDVILSTKKNPDMINLNETPSKAFLDTLETPFKEQLIAPLPNTPRFAIPLDNSETPAPKIYSNGSELKSLIKCNDILTPSFPITPGIKETPPKDIADGASPSIPSGYESRRTDYSSCSSYYKPDESEDVVHTFNQKGRGSERFSESEKASESEPERPLRIVTDVMSSAKKVECQGAIVERVKSFTEEQKEIPTPHYLMVEEGILSESFITETAESSSSTCTTCSTCSSGSSSDIADVQQLISEELPETEEKEKDWVCHTIDAEATTSSVVNEETGEVRFPIRNWITPRKEEPDPSIEEQRRMDEIRAEMEKRAKYEELKKEMELKRQRMLQNIKKDSSKIKLDSNATQKFTNRNLKTYKYPPQMSKTVVTTRKDEILSQQHVDRPKPTTLKLIPSITTSRRKSATPKKTIVINELPRQESPTKERKKRKKENPTKSPTKQERVTIENLNDNAVMPENTHLSLNVSTSFENSFEDESACTVVKVDTKSDNQKSVKEDNKSTEVLKNNDESEGEESESDYELEIRSANDQKIINIRQQENFQQLANGDKDSKIHPIIINFDEMKLTLQDSGNMEIFTMDPETTKKSSNSNKKSSKKDSKTSSQKNGRKSEGNKPEKLKTDSEEKSDVSKKLTSEWQVNSILDKLYGNGK